MKDCATTGEFVEGKKKRILKKIRKHYNIGKNDTYLVIFSGESREKVIKRVMEGRARVLEIASKLSERLTHN